MPQSRTCVATEKFESRADKEPLTLLSAEQIAEVRQMLRELDEGRLEFATGEEVERLWRDLLE